MPPQGGRKHPHQELIQIDTTNILFICGGAFEGIDKIIETRLDRKSIGFNAEIASKHEYDMDVLLHEVLPQDLVKFGLIPELVGRLPVTVSLDLLDKEALIRILTEPKSAIVKQYQKLLELDGVKLEFDRDALTAIAPGDDCAMAIMSSISCSSIQPSSSTNRLRISGTITKPPPKVQALSLNTEKNSCTNLILFVCSKLSPSMISIIPLAFQLLK